MPQRIAVKARTRCGHREDRRAFIGLPSDYRDRARLAAFFFAAGFAARVVAFLATFFAAFLAAVLPDLEAAFFAGFAACLAVADLFMLRMLRS